MPATSQPASSERRRLMVLCRDYNGQKDIRFMMNSDDFRLTDTRLAGDYAILGEGAYDHGTRTLTVEDHAYHVFSDWSLGEPLSLARRASR